MLSNQMEIPKYEKFMYLKGYTPIQILQAAKKNMLEQYAEREKEKEDDEFKIRLEIKK